jgi:hypothetical protein
MRVRSARERLDLAELSFSSVGVRAERQELVPVNMQADRESIERRRKRGPQQALVQKVGDCIECVARWQEVERHLALGAARAALAVETRYVHQAELLRTRIVGRRG